MTTGPDQIKLLKQYDLPLIKQLLLQQQNLPREWVKTLIFNFINIVKNEPNVIRINEPVIVIGDIHGQYFDLLKIMSLFPSLERAPKQHLLFLGDYVDRGPQGVEVIILMMFLKLKYPQKIIMLRGNHESRQMTQIMNFFQQACSKYDQDIYFDFMDAFDALPLATIINQKYFCVHGGITKLGQSIQQLLKLERFDQIPLQGSLCDLVWSDPVQNEEGSMPKNNLVMPNYQRNCSIFFGSEHAKAFLKRQKFVTIIRAHEVQKEGYKQHMWPKWKNTPMVYTIFSAPNYCGSYGNLGAILSISNSQFTIRQFKQSNPKYYIPAKYNAFNFTMKQVFDCVDQVMKRTTKKWVSAKMPELQNLTTQEVIDTYLSSQDCKKRQLKLLLYPQVHIVNENKILTEQQAFSKSRGYFSQSEKRPASLSFKGKQ